MKTYVIQFGELQMFFVGFDSNRIEFKLDALTAARFGAKDYADKMCAMLNRMFITLAYTVKEVD